MMKNVATFTIFFMVLFHAHASAFFDIVETFPFTLLPDDENFYDKVYALSKNDDFIIDNSAMLDENYQDTFMSDEDGLADVTQKSRKKSYVRGEHSVILTSHR